MTLFFLFSRRGLYWVCSCCNKLRLPSTREGSTVGARKKVYPLGIPGLFLVCFYRRHLTECLATRGVPAPGVPAPGVPWVLSERERELLLDPPFPEVVRWRTQIPGTWTSAYRAQHLAQHDVSLRRALQGTRVGQDPQVLAQVLGRVQQHFTRPARD